MVVDFVDVLVERTPVEGAMGPIVPGVFQDEEDCYLVGHFEERREGNACLETTVLSHWVKQPAQVNRCQRIVFD